MSSSSFLMFVPLPPTPSHSPHVDITNSLAMTGLMERIPVSVCFLLFGITALITDYIVHRAVFNCNRSDKGHPLNYMPA